MNKNVLNRRNFMKASASLALLSFFPRLAFAKTIKRVSQTGKQLALKGFDTTAYFTNDSHAKGTSSLIVKWKGANWRFASQKDADLFRNNPDAYAPQFGGYCTRAMSLGREIPADPKVWRIHKDKLYVFLQNAVVVFLIKGRIK